MSHNDLRLFRPAQILFLMVAIFFSKGFLGWGFLYKHKRITLGRKSCIMMIPKAGSTGIVGCMPASDTTLDQDKLPLCPKTSIP